VFGPLDLSKPNQWVALIPSPATTTFVVLETDYTSYSVFRTCIQNANNTITETLLVFTRAPTVSKRILKIVKRLIKKFTYLDFKDLAFIDQTNC
jgi:hypothetical protein